MSDKVALIKTKKAVQRKKLNLKLVIKVKGCSQSKKNRVTGKISLDSELFIGSLIMQLTRLGSLNALDSELRLPKKIESFIGKDKPSVDTIGEVFTKIIPDDLRRLHRGHCYRLKRNKALDTALPLNAIGIDGHEFFSH